MQRFILLAIILASTNGFALINGKPLKDAVDLVRIKFSNGWVCTGTFVDAYTILTAAHCLVREDGKQPIHVDKIYSENDEEIPLQTMALIPHPSFSGQWWPAYDIGLIKTAKNNKFKGNFRLEQEVQHVTGSATLMGAGKIDLLSDIRARTVGQNSFIRVGSVLFFLGKTKNIESEAGVEVTVAPNDSGGPVLDRSTSRIIGVLTTTTVRDSAKYGMPAMSTATSTAAHITFLMKHLGSHSE